eukprot:gene34765-42881_t
MKNARAESNDLRDFLRPCHPPHCMHLGNALTLISGAIFQKGCIDISWFNRMDAPPCSCIVQDGLFDQAHNTMLDGNICCSTGHAVESQNRRQAHCVTATTGQNRWNFTAQAPDCPIGTSNLSFGRRNIGAVNRHMQTTPATQYLLYGLINRLEQALERVAKQPEVQAAMQKAGAEPTWVNAQGMASFMQADTAQWKKVASFAKITLD